MNKQLQGTGIALCKQSQSENVIVGEMTKHYEKEIPRHKFKNKYACTHHIG